MKTINVRLTNKSAALEVLSELENDIPPTARKSPTFQLGYEEVSQCIHDFVSKAQRLAHPGTTLHLKKEIHVENLKFVIVLDTGKQRGLLDKFKRLFQ